MDNPLLRPSAHSLQKPQVFVKVEFGVSWTGQHTPRQRGFEYKSRGLRERNPDFPRRVPPPTTNYLAATSMQSFQQNHQIPRFNFQDAPHYQERTSHVPPTQARDARGSQPPPRYTNTDYMPPQQYHEPARGRTRHLEAIPEPPSLGLVPDEERRLSTGERNERGSSAPPPLSDNNWDVVRQRPSTQRNGGPSNEQHMAQDNRTSSNLWKDLPEAPNRFRLGEEDLPWEGTWTFPMGFEPFLEPDPYLQTESSSSSTHPPSSAHQRPSSTSQRPHSPPGRGDDPARRRELEALGSAMMTVDNGFESQWWNQEERGERRQLAAVHPPPATEAQVEEQMALGWVGALLPTLAPGESLAGGGGSSSGRMSFVSPEGTMAPGSPVGHGGLVVSPVSEFSGPVANLSRSLSTRSDELWFCGRYA